MKLFPILIVFQLVFFAACESPLQFETYINDAWQLIPSSKTNTDGATISQADFESPYFIQTQLPSTVLSALVKAGVYENIYYADNLEKIDTVQFTQSWWYRKVFKIEQFSELEMYEIFFEGINYRANIWLNGVLIASKDSIEGPYRMFSFDITKLAQTENVLAVEVFPPAKSDLTIGFVDWNPNTPDKNMGIWRGVKLLRSRGVVIRNITVKSDIDLQNFSKASLQLQIEIENKSNKLFNGRIITNIGNGISFDEQIEINANETKVVTLTEKQQPKLAIKKPRIWWPIHMGDQELYTIEMSILSDKNELMHKKNDRFGIRQISDFTFMHNNELVRGYKINGKRLLLRGGGWVDDMTLADTDEKVRSQVEYVKHLNLNTIRLEGFWGNSKALYEACDELGILLMVGLSCQWEWEAYSGRPESKYMSVETDEDIKLISQSFQDQVRWGMNHPSIFLWVYGSDKLPSPKFEASLNAYIKAYDNDRCILAACKSRWQENDQFQISEISGNPGSKMLGPYEYVPPVYWYENNRLGSAYGFNTETGPGAQVPPIESLQKMLRPEDLDKINQTGWQYHTGRNQFQTLDIFLQTYNNRYWESKTADEFAFNVQMSNYEAMRAMFEAFEINRYGSATGVVQWMLNSAWPNTMWQLYDWYLNPNGAFYGAKTACQPLSVIYNYANKALYWTNRTAQDELVQLECKVYDNSSNLIFEKSELVNLKSFDVQKWIDLSVSPKSNLYFLSIQLKDQKANILFNNFYWLSKISDAMDYTQSTWYFTPQTIYAQFSDLKKIETAKLRYDINIIKDGENEKMLVQLQNVSDKISFFNEMRVIDTETNQNILPVFWSDNYVSLLPGEKRTYSVTYKKPKARPRFVISGMNTEFLKK